MPTLLAADRVASRETDFTVALATQVLCYGTTTAVACGQPCAEGAVRGGGLLGRAGGERVGFALGLGLGLGGHVGGGMRDVRVLVVRWFERRRGWRVPREGAIKSDCAFDVGRCLNTSAPGIEIVISSSDGCEMVDVNVKFVTPAPSTSGMRFCKRRR